MSILFENLALGLQQAIDYEKGEGQAKEYSYSITPIKDYSGKEIRAIRMKNKMTQVVFALYMGVAKKTVEAWEHETTRPSGSAKRLLSILDNGYAVPFVEDNMSSHSIESIKDVHITHPF